MPPISRRAYHSAGFSSKRRMSAIWVSSRRASSPSSRVWGGAVFVCAIGLSLEPSFCRCYRVLPCTSLLVSARLAFGCASPSHCATLAFAGGLPSEGAQLVDREAAALPGGRHQDRETHRDLRGGPGNHRANPDLPPRRPGTLP